MKEFFLNPFKYVAGFKALLFGIPVIVVTSLVSFNSSVIYQNILKIRFVPETAPLWAFFLNNIVSWLSIAFFLYIFGILISRSKIRFVDILGTQALARFPLIIYSFAGFFPSVKKYNNITLRGFLEGEKVSFTSPDVWGFLIISLIGAFLIVWYIMLMYNAYSLSCNLKKEKGIISFISAIVIGGFFARVIYLSIAAWILGPGI